MCQSELVGNEEKLRDLIKQGKALPITGSSQALKRWGKQHSRLTDDPQKLLKMTGAIFGWTNEDDPAHGHVGIVKGRQTDIRGKVVAIKTYEFNTDLVKGDRDGEGAYSLKRVVPVDRGHSLWFVDLTGCVGGDWWPRTS